MKRILATAALVLIVFTGCDDEPVTGVEAFRVTITVSDPSGAAVEGLEVSAAPDLPMFYQDDADTPTPPTEDGGLRVYPSPFFPVAALEFDSEIPSHALLTIEDVEGRLVETLVDEELAAGNFRVMWSGKGAPGGPSPGGVYFAHLRLGPPGEPRLDESEPMLYVPLYPQQHSIGVTDSRGRLVLEDARHFPQLYELPGIEARDETGALIATIVLGPTMRFYLRDPDSGQMQRFDRDVDGSCRLEMMWDPEG